VNLYQTKKGVAISVHEGMKKDRSKYDFIVKYTEPRKRMRTPKHIHLIVDMYLKWAGNKELTLKLSDHLVSVYKKLRPVNKFPPQLQVFKSKDVKKFEKLDKYGEYDIEFLLVVSELLMIQEKTNYPRGSLTRNMYEAFGREDIFGVVSAASFRGQVR